MDSAHINRFLPIKDGLQDLLETVENFRRGWPLHVLAIVPHGLDAVEASGHLVDVGLDFVTTVISDNCQRCFRPLVPHAGQGAPPHLHDRGK